MVGPQQGVRLVEVWCVDPASPESGPVFFFRQDDGRWRMLRETSFWDGKTTRRAPSPRLRQGSGGQADKNHDYRRQLMTTWIGPGPGARIRRFTKNVFPSGVTS